MWPYHAEQPLPQGSKTFNVWTFGKFFLAQYYSVLYLSYLSLGVEQMFKEINVFSLYYTNTTTTPNFGSSFLARHLCKRRKF